jgi:hypothetical protein
VRPAFEAILELVAEPFAVPASILRQRSHHLARKALAQLAWREAGLRLAAIGEWMELTGQVVGHVIRRGDELETSVASYAAAMARISRQLTVAAGEESPF